MTEATHAVQAACWATLEAVGFDGAPRALGLDDDGRQVLEYIPGSMASELPGMRLDQLHRLGALIRLLHDATETFQAPGNAHWQVVIPPDREDLICHNDLAPWNLVCEGERWVFIDWDGAGPGSRLWDLGLRGPSLRPHDSAWRSPDRRTPSASPGQRLRPHSATATRATPDNRSSYAQNVRTTVRLHRDRSTALGAPP